MKRVLFIAYHYPPIQAGSERSVRFIKHLPPFGYEPVVLTTSAFGKKNALGAIRAWEPLAPYRKLWNPEQWGTPHIRTGAGGARGIIDWFRRYILFPDAQIGWLPPAIWHGLRCIRKMGVRLIFSSYPPASSHLVGLALKRLTGLPWVADFRDCWTYDRLDAFRGNEDLWAQAEHAVEARVVREADRILVVTGVSRRNFLRRYPEASRKFVYIPNGFEPAEIANRDTTKNARMRMVHTGSFSLSHPRRSPAKLFEAMRRMDESPELVLVGPMTETENQMASDLVDQGHVRMIGNTSREDARAYQRSADLLILIDHPREIQASNIPSKFYEYISTGRPTLAIVPDGATREMIAELKAGIAVDPESAEEIKSAISNFAEQWRKSGNLRSGISAGSLIPFHWGRLTERLVSTFEETA